MTETAQRIANNFFTRYEGSSNPEEIYSTEMNNRLRDQILDAFNPSHPTILPSDEEIDEIAFRRLLLTNRDANTELQDRMLIIDGLKIMRSLCEAKIAEMEREMKDFRELARLVSALNEEHEHFKSIAGYIKLARKLLTTTTP